VLFAVCGGLREVCCGGVVDRVDAVLCCACLLGCAVGGP
jgi:hypothetical protein